MILKGSQRAGARQLAAHLLNARDNEHVQLHELRGFAADDLRGALTEAHAISKGTKCKQFLFSLSLNPPQGEKVSEAEFERAAEEAEKVLGLNGQPRAIIFHEKEGRRHAHVVWSRIDASSMRAINLPHFKRRLTELSRELYLENGWKLPDGLRRDGGKSPLNFTLSEWQHAKRLGCDPREIKEVFREAWAQSDSLKALGNALAERGYFLAQGDRRGFVALDTEGQVYSVVKWAGVKVSEARAKLGEAAELPTFADMKAAVGKLIHAKLKSFIAEVKTKQSLETASLREAAQAMGARHSGERALLSKRQKERWAEETRLRTSRFRAGLRGLLDTVTGKTRAIRAANEAEVLQGLRRDREQRDALVWAQLKERAPLQAQFQKLRERHRHELAQLARTVVQSLRQRLVERADLSPATPRRRRRDGPSLER